jgi:hypothetical protein
MNQTLQGVMSIVTPTLGALLPAIMPLPAILAIDIATALLAVGPLFSFPSHSPSGLTRAARAIRPGAACCPTWQLAFA